MSGSITKILRIQFFLLLCSSYAFGQIVYFGEKTGFPNEVVTGHDFILYYEMDPKNGSFTLVIKDGKLNEKMSKVYNMEKDFFKINHEVVDEKVYLLFSNRNKTKTLSVIDTKTLDVQFFPISVSLEYVHLFKVIENTILVVQHLEQGDFVQLNDYRTGIQISLSELYYPKTKIWDVQVKDGIFDMLVYKKGDFRNQSLKMLGFNAEGSKLYETEILSPGSNKLIFKSAKLVPSGETGYRIAGTYARKQGEQFSGYYHVRINDSLEQKAEIYPMRSLEGFFDYKKNSSLRKNTKSLRRNIEVYQTFASGDFVALASSSENVSRKFVHFILIDHTGARIYDTSVKVFYQFGEAFFNSTLALIGEDLYFLFVGSPKYKVLPGFKIFRISDGELADLSRAKDYLKQNTSEWEEIKYYHWKDNKFIVLGIETMDGLSRYVIRIIEV